MAASKIAILGQFVSQFDGRIIKFSNAISENGDICEVLSFVGENGAYPTLANAKLLDWQQGAVLRLPLARIWGALRSAAPSNIAKAAAQRAIMEKALRNGKYRIAIATDPETLLIAARAKKSGGYKLIYDAHEFFEEEVANDVGRKNWVKKTHRKAAPAIDIFITVNEAIAEEYAQSEPNFPKAIVIHNATEFDPALRDDGRLRAAAKLQANDKILLYQGGLAKDRGLHQLVKAFDEPIGDWKLIMMGSGALEKELREIASSRIIFLPPAPQNELKYWTAGADLGAIFYEPTCKNQLLCSPNKLWEYSAAGVPIIASDLPFLGKMVHENGIGILLTGNFEPKKFQQLLVEFNKADFVEKCYDFSNKCDWESQSLQLKKCVLDLT